MFFYNNSISYSNEYSPSNFTVSSDSNGYPYITNVVGSTITDVNRLCIYELFRRIFPAVRSSGLLQLASSTSSSPTVKSGMIQVQIHSYFNKIVQR